MCCYARERTAGPLIHIYTARSSLCLSSEYTYIYICVCVQYIRTLYTPFRSHRDPSLSRPVCLHLSVSLSASLSLSDNMCPKVLFRCCGGIKTKRCAHRLNGDYHKHDPIHGAPARLTMFIQTVYRCRVTRTRTHSGGGDAH
jgi:hypothetical protein